MSTNENKLSMTISVELDSCWGDSVEFPILGDTQQAIDIIRSRYTDIGNCKHSEHYMLESNDLDDVSDAINLNTHSIITKTSLHNAASFLDVNNLSPCDVYIS